MRWAQRTTKRAYVYGSNPDFFLNTLAPLACVCFAQSASQTRTSAKWEEHVGEQVRTWLYSLPYCFSVTRFLRRRLLPLSFPHAATCMQSGQRLFVDSVQTHDLEMPEAHVFGCVADLSLLGNVVVVIIELDEEPEWRNLKAFCRRLAHRSRQRREKGCAKQCKCRKGLASRCRNGDR